MSIFPHRRGFPERGPTGTWPCSREARCPCRRCGSARCGRLLRVSGDVWGLVSDVHGNYPALQQALAVLSDAGATKFAFLGDYLGRGDSDACIERIREVADVAVVGNRDLDWQDRVNPESKAYVLSLPKQAQCQRLLL